MVINGWVNVSKAVWLVIMKSLYIYVIFFPGSGFSPCFLAITKPTSPHPLLSGGCGGEVRSHGAGHATIHGSCFCYIPSVVQARRGQDGGSIPPPCVTNGMLYVLPGPGSQAVCPVNSFFPIILSFQRSFRKYGGVWIYYNERIAVWVNQVNNEDPLKYIINIYNFTKNLLPRLITA